jgi:hypothetical protein
MASREEYDGATLAEEIFDLISARLADLDAGDPIRSTLQQLLPALGAALGRRPRLVLAGAVGPDPDTGADGRAWGLVVDSVEHALRLPGLSVDTTGALRRVHRSACSLSGRPAAVVTR